MSHGRGAGGARAAAGGVGLHDDDGGSGVFLFSDPINLKWLAFARPDPRLDRGGATLPHRRARPGGRPVRK